MLKRSFIIIIFIFSFFYSLFSQSIKNMEFNNQEIRDILLALAAASGKSIISDETVTGKATFYFTETDFEESLENFLQTYKLYSKKENNIIKVSRIYSSFNSEKATLTLRADNVSIESLLKAISKEIGKTILYDNLPANTITVSMEEVSVEEALDICIKKLSDYSLESQNSYYYVKKDSLNNLKKGKNNNKILTHTGNLYSLNLEKGTLFDVLPKLFNEEKVEYSLFIQNDTQLSNLYFINKDFETILSLILEHANADYAVRNGIYYIIDLHKKGIGGKIRSTEICNLKWLQVQDFISLLPSELSSNSLIKIDKNTNSLILTGTSEEIEPIKNFIKNVDLPSGGLIFKKYRYKILTCF